MCFTWGLGFYKDILFKLNIHHLPHGGEGKGKYDWIGFPKTYVTVFSWFNSNKKNIDLGASWVKTNKGYF